MRNTNLKPWPARPGTRSTLAIVLAFVMFGVAICMTVQAWRPLQHFYLRQYLLAQISRPAGTASHQIMLVASRQGNRRQALNADVQPGDALDQTGKHLPFELSPSARNNGYSRLEVVSTVPMTNFSASEWMRKSVYDGKTLLVLFDWPCILFFIVLTAGIILVSPMERKAALIRKYGRQIGGPEALGTRQFNARIKGDGIGIISKESGIMSLLFRSTEPQLRIPISKESSGGLLVGGPGSGKSSVLLQLLVQVETRGERAVIYDPHGEFVRRFYQEDRGDVILNPWDVRSPWWDLAAEITHPAVTATIANSLFPPVPGEHEFFARVCRQIQAYFLGYSPTVHEFADWLSNPKMIEELLRETAMASAIDPAAGPQRIGVTSTLALIVDALKSIPTRDQCQSSWSSADWAESSRGWIFLTSDSMSRDSLRPLHSAWFDLLIMRLLNTMDVAGPKTWLCLDELASLHRLPQLVTCLVETRKTGNPLFFGFQSPSQIKTIYGDEWDAILSVPYTKYFLRTTSPEAKEWMSLIVGEVEEERLREEDRRDVSGGITHSESWEFMTRRLILPSEFGCLDDLHGFLVVGGVVTEFRTRYPDIPFVCEMFIERPTNQPVRPAAISGGLREVF